MTTTAPAPAPILGVLARQEIRNYLRSRLFWAGTALLIALQVFNWADRGATWTGGNGPSAAYDMISPAALLGLFGMIVMAGLTKRSDRAAAAAGAVAVPERTRTLALTAAAVVPLVTALAWFAEALTNYLVEPPAAYTVPFGPIGDGYVFTVMFALGVVAAIGGPVLGLLIARWLPSRGAVPLAVVLVVLLTILMQGNFRSTWHWRMVWPWTYWYGPFGWNNTDRWVVLPGSPYAWLVYLFALCGLGVLAAVYHDPESDRRALRRAISATVLVAAVMVVLSMTLGLNAAAVNPVVVPAG